MVEISLVNVGDVRLLNVVRLRRLYPADDGEHFLGELGVVDVALALEQARLALHRFVLGVRVQVTELVVRLN